jgi:hypothetical protein
MKKKENKGLFFILAIILIIIGFWYYNNFINNSPKEGEQVKIDNNTEKIEKEYVFTDKEIKEGDNINISYLNFGIKEIDSEIDEFINSRLEDYKNSLVEGGETQTLDISYDLEQYSKEIISIKFNILYGGGVRPVEDISCFTFDLGKGKRVSLADFFKQSSGYLDKLSDLAYKSLLNDSDAELAKEGTLPKDENFQNFVITKNSFIFYFAPCLVDSCSAGLKEVVVPIKEIKVFLKDEFLQNVEAESKSNGITVSSVKDGTVILSPLEISGIVNGNGWISFEGTAGRVELLDGNKKVIANSNLGITSDGFKLPVSFKAVLNFIKPETESGELVFYNENPSGMEDNNKTYEIKVKFQ